MKKISALWFLFTFIILLSGCSYEYDGIDVETIRYTTVNYMGGYRRETIVNLEDGMVYHREYFPDDEETVEFEMIFEFDTSKVDKFMNEAGKKGLFSLEDQYQSPEGIVDGGEWNLEIKYVDGTVQQSEGINNFPDTLKEADYAFFTLYGDDLFSSVPNSYKNPPSIDYSIRTTSKSSSSGLSPMTYTWHGKEVVNENVFQEATETLFYDFDTSIEYTLVLWTANYDIKFSKMILTSYDLDGTNETAVDSTRFFKQKEYQLDFDKVYKITMTFEHGTCDYYISTNILE